MRSSNGSTITFLPTQNHAQAPQVYNFRYTNILTIHYSLTLTLSLSNVLSIPYQWRKYLQSNTILVKFIESQRISKRRRQDTWAMLILTKNIWKKIYNIAEGIILVQCADPARNASPPYENIRWLVEQSIKAHRIKMLQWCVSGTGL